MPVERIEVGYMPAATAISPVPVPPTKKPAKNEAVPSIATDDVAWPNQASPTPPPLAPRISPRNAPPPGTAHPDWAQAITLPRLFRPMIRAAADSEKPTELSTAGVQNVTVTSTM